MKKVRATLRRAEAGRMSAIAAGFLAVVALALLPAGARGATEAASVAATSAHAPTRGDADCSGYVTGNDALQILRSQAGLQGAGCVQSYGDADCSGETDAADVLAVLRYAGGIPTQSIVGCQQVGEPIPSSQDLIDQAFSSGQITQDQALAYGVYAEHGDERLPQQYRGVQSTLPDSDASMLAAIQFDHLSPESQGAIRPYLTPPGEPESWLPSAVGVEAQSDWQTFPAADGKVKVWARRYLHYDEVVRAGAIAEAINTTIWPALTQLAGEQHMPLSDAGLPKNGGDDALDIYLVDMSEGTLGVTIPYLEEEETEVKPAKCELTPAFINIKGNEPLGSATEPGMLQTVAHEMYHAIQLTYDLQTDCYYPEYKWFMEASSTWVEDYVYPNANAEQRQAGPFLWWPASLDAIIPLFNHEYGAYLFPLYLVRASGEPAIVSLIWDSFATHSSIGGIQSIIEPIGGFDEIWPKFVGANFNWDQTPVHPYLDWDGLEDGAYQGVEMAGISNWISLYPGDTKPIPSSVHYLDVKYQKVWLAPGYEGNWMRSAVFHNTLVDVPHASVQAFIKTSEGWDVEDWSQKKTRAFCFDKPEDWVEQVIIVIGNSDWEDQNDLSPAEQPTFVGSAVPCAWQGEAHSTTTFHGPGENWTVQMDATSLVYLPNEEITGRSEAVSGTVTATFSGIYWYSEGQPCTVNGTKALSVDAEPAWHYIQVVSEGAGVLHYKAVGFNDFDVPLTITCPGDDPIQSTNGALHWLATADDEVSTDPSVLDGSRTDEPIQDVTATYHWHFTAADSTQ